MALPTALASALNAVLFGGATQRIRNEQAEHAIVAAAREGSSEAFVQLVYAYGPSLRAIVGDRYGNPLVHHPNYRKDAPEVNDLHGACVDVMLTAISKFNPNEHHRLAATLTMASAARKAADAALNPSLRGLAAYVPDGSLSTYNWLLRRAEERIRETEGRDALSYHETVEVAALIATEDPRVTLSADAVRSIAAVMDSSNTVCLDADPVVGTDGDERLTLAETLEDPGAAVSYAEAEAKLLAAQALAVLPEDELEVVRYAYGFPPESYREMSDGEVAEELKERHGYSRSKVNRMRNRALGRMRMELGVDPE